ADAGDGGGGVRVQELRAVADDPAPLEILPGEIAAGVDERQDRQVEAVTPLHEPRRLLRRVDVEAAGLLHGLVRDHTDGAAAEPAEAGDHARGIAIAELE